jgi:hypothetical protein
MSSDERGSRLSDLFSELSDLIKKLYIENVPSYGNSFWFQLGFYIIVLGIFLGITGGIMLIFGPYWWNYTEAGIIVSQIHFWTAEILMTLLILHLFVNFSTSAYKKRKDSWVIGVLLFVLTMLTYVFGVGLNNNIVAQYNDKSGAGFWNSILLGWIINPENFGAVLGWHVMIIPAILLLLVSVHFVLAWRRGLTTPHIKSIKFSIVKADHRKMFVRASAIVVVAIAAGFVLGPYWAYPFVPALNAQWAAQHYPDTFAATLLQELNSTSGTATYSKFSPLGDVNPYADSNDQISYVNTSQVYVIGPYNMLLNSTGGRNYLQEYLAENSTQRINQLNSAYSFFTNGGSIQLGLKSSNPVEVAVSQLTLMAKSGLYDGALYLETYDHSSLDQTYTIRLLSDMGLIHTVEGIQYRLNEKYFGMLKFNVEPWQIGAYWMLPYDLLEAWGDTIPWWHSLYNELILGAFTLIILLLPWTPGLRDIPDHLKLYKLFWNRYTIPEMKQKHHD